MEKVINLPAELTREEFTKEIKGTIISIDKPHNSGFHDYETIMRHLNYGNTTKIRRKDEKIRRKDNFRVQNFEDDQVRKSSEATTS